jgi:DNA-binding FadR family transcriptional regulator
MEQARRQRQSEWAKDPPGSPVPAFRRGIRVRGRSAEHESNSRAAILQGSGNSLLDQLHRYLAPLLCKSREITVHTSGLWESMCQDHARIVEAIIRGEPESVEHAMMEHMHHIGHDLTSSEGS